MQILRGQEMASSDVAEKTVAISSSLSNGDLLTIIGVIIALSAYIATVRGRILDKISRIKFAIDANDKDIANANAIVIADDLKAKKEDLQSKKENLQSYVKSLMFADVPLISSGFMLAFYTGLKIFANSEIGILLNWGMSLFAIALAVLAIFHALEWIKSFKA
jgi:hypothetical protein